MGVTHPSVTSREYCFASRASEHEKARGLETRGRHGTRIHGGMPSRTGPVSPSDRRAVIAAKSIHRELRLGGFTDEEVVRLASELLTLVTDEVRSRRSAS